MQIPPTRVRTQLVPQSQEKRCAPTQATPFLALPLDFTPS